MIKNVQPIFKIKNSKTCYLEISLVKEITIVVK